MDFEAPVDAWYVWMGVAVVSLSIAGVALSLPTTAPPDANAAANTVDSVGSKPYTASATYEHDADQYWASNETILLRNDGGTTRATIRFGLMAPAWPKDDLRDVVYGASPEDVYGAGNLDDFKRDVQAARRAAWDGDDRVWAPASGELTARKVTWGEYSVVLVVA